MNAPYFVRHGRIHAAADERGLPTGGLGVRRDFEGFHQGRCVCGWSVARKRRAIAETRLANHICDSNLAEVSGSADTDATYDEIAADKRRADQ